MDSHVSIIDGANWGPGFEGLRVATRPIDVKRFREADFAARAERVSEQINMSDKQEQPEAVAAEQTLATAEPEQGGKGSEKELGGGKDGKSAKKGSDKASRAHVHLAEDKDQLSTLVKTARKHKHSDGRVILVPVDFSAPSRDALLFAADLAHMTSATLLVLHVVHDPGEMPGYYTKLVKKKRVARIQDIAKEVFDEFMHEVIKEHSKLKALRHAKNVMVIGLPVTRILQVVEKVEPLMVVMGSQGRTGLKHLFLGSKAEQVVQLCPVPVTIVKQKQ